MRKTPLTETTDWKVEANCVAAHQHVRYVRGNPGPCGGCGATNTEWANISGAYHDPIDFVALCRSCHHRFDRPSQCKQGHIMPPTGRCPECRKASRRAAYRRKVATPEGRERHREACRRNTAAWRRRNLP